MIFVLYVKEEDRTMIEIKIKNKMHINCDRSGIRKTKFLRKTESFYLHKVLYLNSISNQSYCEADKRFLSPDRRPLKTRTQPRHVFLLYRKPSDRKQRKSPGVCALKGGASRVN